MALSKPESQFGLHNELSRNLAGDGEGSTQERLCKKASFLSPVGRRLWT